MNPHRLIPPRERLKAELVSQRLKAGGSFIDIGACVGVFTYLAAEIVGPSGVVIAFEPEQDNYHELREDGKQFPNIRYHCVALSNYNDYGWLYISDFRGKHTLQKNRDVIDSHIQQFVRIHTLDSYVTPDPVDAIKIDVQGSELNVLEGAVKTLEKTRFVAIDVHPHLGVSQEEIEQFLQGHGFEILSFPKQVNEIFAERVV